MSLASSFINAIKKKPLLLLGICWLLMQLLCFRQFGIVTGFEAKKYIAEAESLRTTGHYSSGNFLFYSVESCLILLSKTIGVFPWGVVLLQLVANAISAILFYRLVDLFTKNKVVAFAATLFLLSMFYYQSYNVHLFTESLFFSFSIGFAYWLFTRQRLDFITILVSLLALGLLLLTRPTGILFLPPTLFYFIFRFSRKRAWPLFFGSIGIGLLLFYFLLNAALNAGGEFDFLLPFAEEHIICGVPRVQPPHNLSVPVNKNSVEGLWYVVSHNDALFLRLAKERCLAFWGVRRSFFSAGHNAFVCLYFYTLYLLIVLGLRRLFRYALPQTVFMLSYAFLIMLTVLLSCDEWHNRFLYSLLPFLILLATGLFIKKPAGE